MQHNRFTLLDYFIVVAITCINLCYFFFFSFNNVCSMLLLLSLIICHRNIVKLWLNLWVILLICGMAFIWLALVAFDKCLSESSLHQIFPVGFRDTSPKKISIHSQTEWSRSKDRKKPLVSHLETLSESIGTFNSESVLYKFATRGYTSNFYYKNCQWRKETATIIKQFKDGNKKVGKETWTNK